jgi:hypothetical protein
MTLADVEEHWQRFKLQAPIRKNRFNGAFIDVYVQEANGDHRREVEMTMPMLFSQFGPGLFKKDDNKDAPAAGSATPGAPQQMTYDDFLKNKATCSIRYPLRKNSAALKGMTDALDKILIHQMMAQHQELYKKPAPSEEVMRDRVKSTARDPDKAEQREMYGPSMVLKVTKETKVWDEQGNERPLTDVLGKGGHYNTQFVIEKCSLIANRPCWTMRATNLQHKPVVKTVGCPAGWVETAQPAPAAAAPPAEPSCTGKRKRCDGDEAAAAPLDCPPSKFQKVEEDEEPDDG